jgi:transposase InsO family protein
MPWEVAQVLELRLAFVHQVVSLNVPLARACRHFNISRKTGYKWLARYRTDPPQPLTDRSRRPQRSPRKTTRALERKIVSVRKRYRWGPRKIRALLVRHGLPVPSVRTVANILVRNGCIMPPASEPEPQPVQFFERTQPNQLWQCDHKGPLEVARQEIHPFTVLDDHSRFLFTIRACTDLTMRTAFDVLWDVFGEFGLPDSLLADNAFGTNFSVPKTLSWFDAQLVRLGIKPVHGRPYHPQTQGKIERLHGTLERELWPVVRRDSIPNFQRDVNHWRAHVYNTLRPHEALGDVPPVTRFRRSPRRRPPRMPPVDYPTDAVLRRVSRGGDISFNSFRILAGTGLAGEFVRVEDRGHEIALFYSWKQFRVLAASQLHRHNLS